jgi:hypothetical protein
MLTNKPTNYVIRLDDIIVVQKENSIIVCKDEELKRLGKQ